MDLKPVIILGNGGHAKVITDILRFNNRDIIGFTAPTEEVNYYDIQYLGGDNAVFQYNHRDVHLVNGIGSTSSVIQRKALFEYFRRNNYVFSSVIHPNSTISSTVKLGEGVQIMAGAIIQPFAQVADNTIINTSVSIDHDTQIGSHCHIAPGVTISGSVSVGDASHVGAGSTIIQNVKVGNSTLIGAGSLVLKNIKSNSKAYGVPAKEVER
ncbi:acetyltransferase [Lentibacillus saliphilus]|uniref:acetyltransferase n=1 Tax=Lentibacillus saliphilus TaxID=2737028 RepID=UPI001C2F87B5|nr:acetyltransferase [Lentibacillus saliphilus]